MRKKLSFKKHKKKLKWKNNHIKMKKILRNGSKDHKGKKGQKGVGVEKKSLATRKKRSLTILI